MTNNKKNIQKTAFNDLFSNTSMDSIPSPIVEESESIKKEEIKKEEIKKEENNSKTNKTQRKTYNIPIDIAENMEKIVYMDRDIKDNTDLLIKALRRYLDSKECKKLLEEYKVIKGEK